MARSINKIQTQILDNISNDSVLSNLNSTSNTAIYRVFAYIVAVAINILETFNDQFKREITEIRDTAITGSEEWFIYKAKRFQYDDTTPQELEIKDNYSVDYINIDESKRIISVASCRTLTDLSISLAVAKGDLGSLEPLTQEELDTFTNYINYAARFAGQRLSVISLPADTISFTGDIYYNGEYSQQEVLTSIQNNINTYLTNVEFDGIIRYQKIVDAIQESTGVRDLYLDQMTGAADGQTIPEVFDRIYNSSAGYANLDSNIGNNLTFRI